MALRDLLKDLVFVGVLIGAGYYAGKPSQVLTFNLNNDKYPDVVTTDLIGRKEIYMTHNSGKLIELSETSYTPREKKAIRQGVNSFFEQRNTASQPNPKEESAPQDFKSFLKGLLE